MSRPRKDLQECHQTGTGVETSANNRAGADATPTLRNPCLCPLCPLCPPCPLWLNGFRHVCPQDSCGVRREWPAPALSAEVAGQFFHAQFHQTKGVLKNPP